VGETLRGLPGKFMAIGGNEKKKAQKIIEK
jgi:hypothetical protein